MRVAPASTRSSGRRTGRRGVVRSLALIVAVLLSIVLSATDLAAQAVLSPSSSVEQSDDPVLDGARRRIDSGDLHEAVVMLQDALQEDDGTDLHRKARRLGTLGVALSQAGAAGEAIPVQHQALALYESLADPAGISAVTLNLGNSLAEVGDNASALRHFEAALALKRQHGIERGVGAIYNNIADLVEADGDFEQARHALEQALDAYVLEQNATGESLARANLARVLAQLGQPEAAQEQIQAAESLARSNNSQRALRSTLAANAFVLMEGLRQHAVSPAQRAISLQRAEDSLQQVLAMTRAQDNEPQLIRALHALSRLRELQERPMEALALAREAQKHEQVRTARLTQTRVSVLSARYELARQQRQIMRLRARESGDAARIMRQRLAVWSLAGGLLVAVIGLLALWRYNRLRRAGEEHQQALNKALSEALEQAQEERQHTEAFALRLRRFLRLASEDLRGPLQEIRAIAERALVEDSPDTLRRHHAGIAQRAGDLIWVTDQMLESTDDSLAHADATLRAEPVDLAHELCELVTAAGQRAIHRDQSLHLDCHGPAAFAYIDKSRCVVALRELIDILLYLNPVRTRLDITVEPQDTEIRVALDLGTARLPEWNDIALGEASGDVTLRLALSWIQHAIQDNAGRIVTERLSVDESAKIVIHFPQASANGP